MKKRNSRVLGGAPTWLVGGLAVIGLSAGPLRAQDGSAPLDEADSRFVDVSTLQSRSAFRLFGEGDRAFAGMRPTGNMEYFVTNTGIIDAADLNLDSQPDLFGCADCSPAIFQYFDVSPIYAAPRADWERFIQDVPSLLNAEGRGYTVSANQPTLGHREILASDLQFGTLFSGAVTTVDGGCQDFSAGGPGSNSADPGLTLLALSNCPPTWPDAGFLGANVIEQDAFLNSQLFLGGDFNFDWWRVDPADVDAGAFFGNIQTYGAYDDYNSSMIGRFGNVVPGGSGAPRDEGWPLGIRTEFNAFTFALPTVSNTLFWRAVIINNTQEVYGVGLDYENLYVGYTFNPGRSQEAAFYFEPWRGAILTAEGNTGDPACQGSAPPGVGFIDCSGDPGFDQGVTGMLVLKSPIGDLRNVLLSCDPADPQRAQDPRAVPCTNDDFFDPSNPHAADTITYNHFVMCPFGPCTNQTVAQAERQWFGGIATSTEDLLNGRDLSAIPAADQYTVFRNPNFPGEPVPFVHWVPGTWDYTANGPTEGGDTISVPTCYGPSGSGRVSREDACVVTWSDTMPGPTAYNNQEGNISYGSSGPFRLAAGDTAGYVLALVAGIDSARFEAEVNNAINLYMNFFLAPAPPPKNTIVGVRTDIIDPATGDDPQVQLFWDDAADDWVDPFLVDFAVNKVGAGSTPRLATLRDLNPGLVDRILSRASDNVAELLIFKSCDGGTTFTADDTDSRDNLDCDANPAVGTDQSSIDVGWQAYAILSADAGGNLPNTFTDDLVTPGQTYLYVVLGRTRGATFAVVNGEDLNGDGQITAPDETFPDSLFIAPSLVNPLATSTTEPNVVSVYMPTSFASGGSAARATLVEGDLVGIDRDAELTFAGLEVAAGSYELVFGNQISVEEFRDPISNALDSTRVVVLDTAFAEVAPGVAAFATLDSAAFVTTNPNGVTTNLSDDEDDPPLGFVLLGPDADPLLASNILDGEETTPPDFFDRTTSGSSIGFPGFVVEVDNTNGGDFDRQFWGVTPEDTVAFNAQPTIRWRADESAQSTLRFDPFGKYEIDWTDRAFGPGSPFTIDQVDPDLTQEAYETSLAARQTTTGRTDDAALAAVREVLGSAAPDQLLPVRIPFTVRNVTFDREVDLVALRERPRRVTLGNPQSGDTVSVVAPVEEWIPGDPVALLETVRFDSIATVNFKSAVILDEDGQPIQVEREVMTLQAVMSCGTNPRSSCNPVRDVGVTNPPFVAPFAGQVLSVFYSVPFEPRTRLVFDVESAVTDQAIIDETRDIRAQLDSIKAVPNPYIMFSRYELDTNQENDKRLLFSHLPPRGNLRIFTVAGQFVQELNWGPDDLVGNGDLFWDMRTREGNETASGLYVFVVTAPNPATGNEVKKVGKFVIIR